MQTESESRPQSSIGLRVEVVSTVAIAVLVVFGGRAILAALAQFAGAASMLLFVIALLQAATLIRTLRGRGEIARIAASRDITALVAILFAIVAVLSKASWSIGSTIAAIEFAFVLEIMRLMATARRSS